MTLAPHPASAARLIAEQRSHQPDVVRLAQLLSLAAQAEAYFVREARLRFLPHSSAGLEARLWFSPLVEAADGRTLVLDADVASALRGELTGDRALLDSVRAFTAHAHRDAPLAVRVFESLLWAATAGDAPQEDRVRRALAPFLSRVLAGGAEALEASRWALRYLPRLPAAVRDCTPARRLRIIAAERLGLDPEPAAGGADAREARAVRRLVHGEVDVGVRATPDGIVLTRPPERDALVCQVSGAARVRLRLRAALPGAAWHDLDLHDRRRAAVPLDVLATARLDGTLEAARAEPGDVVRCAWSGGRGAVAVTAGRRTGLRFDAQGRVVSAELPAPPDLLAVADAGPPRAAAFAGAALHAVGAALDGSGEVTVHAWSPAPVALGWIADSVLCVAQGPRVHLLADGDPAHVLRQLGHDAPVARMWTSAALDAVAVADADGRVVLHLAAPAGAVTARVLCGPGPRVTALTGDAASGAIAWADAEGGVHVLASPDEPAAAVAGRAAPAPTSLALLPGAEVVTADGTPCLRRFPPPRTVGDSGPGAGVTVRTGFGVREVYAADDRMVLVGGGAPVEIRSEDGRTHVVLPGAAVEADGLPGPAWLRTSVGVVLPSPEARSQAWADGSAQPWSDAEWLRAARRSGVGHVCVGGPLLDDGPGLAAFVERARGAGLRVVGALRLRHGEAARAAGGGNGGRAGGGDGVPPVETAELLLAASYLLDARLDGLRVACPADAPAGTVREVMEDLRHLVDAYPQAGLIAEHGPADAAHLVLAPPPDPSGPSGSSGPVDPAARGGRWALPDGLPPLDARRLLALPGCSEAPYPLLAADDAESAALRALLAVRGRQLALVHGSVEPVVPAPPDGVTAVWRRGAGQSVLCLVNAAGADMTVHVDAADDEHALVDLTPYEPLHAAPEEPPYGAPHEPPHASPHEPPQEPTGAEPAAPAGRPHGAGGTAPPSAPASGASGPLTGPDRSRAVPGARAARGDTVDAAQPLVVRAVEGRFTVTVGAGRARWLSVWDAGRDAGPPY